MRNCKLQNRIINDGECYDIQMVRHGYIKPSALAGDICLDEADSACSSCRFNELHDCNDVLDILDYVCKLDFPTEITGSGIVIRFHDGFIFEYSWNKPLGKGLINTLINGKPFAYIELQDILYFIERIAKNEFVFIQYSNRPFRKNPFRLKKAVKFKKDRYTSKRIERIFNADGTI